MMALDLPVNIYLTVKVTVVSAPIQRFGIGSLSSEVGVILGPGVSNEALLSINYCFLICLEMVYFVWVCRT